MPQSFDHKPMRIPRLKKMTEASRNESQTNFVNEFNHLSSQSPKTIAKRISKWIVPRIFFVLLVQMFLDCLICIHINVINLYHSNCVTILNSLSVLSGWPLSLSLSPPSLPLSSAVPSPTICTLSFIGPIYWILRGYVKKNIYIYI